MEMETELWTDDDFLQLLFHLYAAVVVTVIKVWIVWWSAINDGEYTTHFDSYQNDDSAVVFCWY